MSRTLAVSVLLLAVPAQESWAQAVDTLEVDDGEVETPAVIPLPPPRVIPRVIPLPPRRPAGLVPDQASQAVSPLSVAPAAPTALVPMAPTAPTAIPSASPVIAAPIAAPVPAPLPAQTVIPPAAAAAPATPTASPVVAAPSAAPMPAPPPAQTVIPPAAAAAPAMVAPVVPAPLPMPQAAAPAPVPMPMPAAASVAHATPQILAPEPLASLPLPQRARNEAALDLPPTGLLGGVQSRLWGLKSGLSDWWYGAPSTYAAYYARREKLFEAAMAAAGFEIASLASEGVFFRTQSVVFIERREPTPLEIEAAERLANELAQEFGGLRGYAEQAAIREALDPSGRDPALQKTIEVQLSPYPWVKSISGLTAPAGRKAP